MKNYPYLVLIIAFWGFVGCSGSNNAATADGDGKVSIATFETKMAEIDQPQLIDVRTPAEFSRGTLNGAVNMDFKSANLENQLNTLDKSKPVFIFCQAGGRSGKCYKKMKDMGFSEVYDMEGGYGAWSK
ncbi:MAG: rhodanese-like domain-containing protein [Bacteroidota bacterium]